MRVKPSQQSLVTQEMPSHRGGIILLPRADSRAVPRESRSNGNAEREALATAPDSGRTAAGPAEESGAFSGPRGGSHASRVALAACPL